MSVPIHHAQRDCFISLLSGIQHNGHITVATFALYHHENRCLKNIGAESVRFWSDNLDSAVFGRLLRKNEKEFWEN